MNFIVKQIIKYLHKRSLEASTWRNFILFIGGSWAVRHPEQAELIVPIAVSIAGFIGSMLPDVLGDRKKSMRILEDKDNDGFDDLTNTPMTRDTDDSNLRLSVTSDYKPLDPINLVSTKQQLSTAQDEVTVKNEKISITSGTNKFLRMSDDFGLEVSTKNGTYSSEESSGNESSGFNDK